MKPIYLFDWGNTLMTDLPGMTGKMCDWPRIEVIEGAEQALRFLSQRGDIYIASGAKESTPADIEQVFTKANLAHYIAGYFCPNDVGLQKGSPAFLLRIMMRLKCPPHQITVIGDSLRRDVQPAKIIGMKAVWFRRNQMEQAPADVLSIDRLEQLTQLH
ncbi:HAD family hydrolase [Neiella sp. HB171785]|uniref:phosphoglycolate phosphatase n=1 Tax=Neiella litorisoli TaxID=2771431 RepID=A0A8J6QL59_9GAMM|nr:HAD family hydrolase [Neiella litorisoli]MBD1390386.1 HAD family hydrolase [Neiella litorisoli]